MTKRKPLSKTLRFEVFKRDAFTCQYCGAKAPDAILHCDHIHPVAEGGKDEVMNLVTACNICNLGKGARKLDDRSKVERQRAQIEALDERREQLEMMLAWRDQAEKEKIDVVDAISRRISERGGWGPNETGRSKIRRWLKTYTVQEVLSAADASFDAYLDFDKDDVPTRESWELVFSKIPAFASIARSALTKPYMPRLIYAQGILRRRWEMPREHFVSDMEMILLEFDADPEIFVEVAKRVETYAELVAQSLERAGAALSREDFEARVGRLKKRWE